MTDTTKIFHNPNCSKCRSAMELLSEKGIQADVVEYLQAPPDKQELEDILNMLKIEPRQLMRTHESEYKDNNLADESLSRDQLIDAMIKFPILIERPIVISNGKAAIGRPTETILEIL
ncbi:MAG: arsenate reductase (glutaredoxin) [endosymbiont of Galathealinum brachiosum]|uniref:Arsenate reductase n=1 Tax=endosymbiont of Galathealinum brachiosum TaxID=2200906 RepID=A0A370D8S7_9GAMM|nr:MAG: arsenate reductase (glutaredoxin) [endosymbiont of Galathealinum brachiosum]